ncbi:hypothetical protein [Brachybacterium sp. UMB0905]|uniref:hypothetical protein n=1 Tax=Brachybacterium sp. UMB0905 TaxID=2069310 RepID=UPI000C804A66|nr:hypothetical protein [Brachybacterium sp. UMB0905]PMC75353.1 hypothetical protein CJ197_08415 [Brachybacterium sp. UMB0905]
MTVLSIAVVVLAVLTSGLGLLYAVKDLAADLVLLGAAALLALAWVVFAIAVLVRDVGGDTPPDPITLYGYLLTAVLLVIGGAWAGLFERTRWGSVVIAVAALVDIVLLVRLGQIWPGLLG